jgi:hypothetical protein
MENDLVLQINRESYDAILMGKKNFLAIIDRHAPFVVGQKITVWTNNDLNKIEVCITYVEDWQTNTGILSGYSMVGIVANSVNLQDKLISITYHDKGEE